MLELVPLVPVACYGQTRARHAAYDISLSRFTSREGGDRLHAYCVVCMLEDM